MKLTHQFTNPMGFQQLLVGTDVMEYHPWKTGRSTGAKCLSRYSVEDKSNAKDIRWRKARVDQVLGEGVV